MAAWARGSLQKEDAVLRPQPWVEALDGGSGSAPDERTLLWPSPGSRRGAALAQKAAAPDAPSAPPSLLRSPISWTRRLVRTYSWRLLAMVVCTNHLLKGLVAGGGDGGLLGAPMEFLFKDHKVNGAKMQVYMAVATSPWALKPLIGLLSDNCPMFGYQKMPYILATSAAGVAAALVLGLRASDLSLPVLVQCLFFVFLQVSTMDLLVEAKQSAEVKNSAELGPDFFLFTWLGIIVGSIAAAVVAGSVIQFMEPQSCYLMALPLMVLATWPAAMNYLGEQPLHSKEWGSRWSTSFRRHPELCSLALAMGAILAGITAVTLQEGPDSENLWVVASAAASLPLLGAFAFFIRSEMANPVIFWFMLQAWPKVDGALFYFYTDGPQHFPGGPAFSPWFYATAMNLVGFLGVLAGYLTGSDLFKTWRYPRILLLTIPLRAAVRLALLPVILRWTTTRYHVPDAWLVLPVEFFGGMAYSWSWIPKQVMNAHMTPNGCEATMLALMSGTFNMAGMVSSFLGCWLLSKFRVCAYGDERDAAAFEGLWRPYLISVVGPVGMLVFLPFLIPNRLQTEIIIDDHPESSTHGSPFRRCLQRCRGARAAGAAV